MAPVHAEEQLRSRSAASEGQDRKRLGRCKRVFGAVSVSARASRLPARPGCHGVG